MATATIVAAWTDNTNAYLSVAVNENGRRVEYTGVVDKASLQSLSQAEKKAALVAAVKAVRDAQINPIVPDGTLTGNVTI